MRTLEGKSKEQKQKPLTLDFYLISLEIWGFAILECPVEGFQTSSRNLLGKFSQPEFQNELSIVDEFPVSSLPGPL